jgi:hypothetical protein
MQAAELGAVKGRIAGKLTNVFTPLAFGPVITGVEPSGFSTWGRFGHAL